jgi:AraC-like DNA-binding protein
MSGSIVTVEVKDPHEITPTMWELFRPTSTSAITPPQFLARGYRAADWQRYKGDKDSYRTTVSVGKIGQICFVRMADRHATDMVIGSPGLDHYCLSFVQQGSGAFRSPESHSAAEIAVGEGVIFRGTPGTVLQTGGQAVKLNVWIPAYALHRQAAVLLGGRNGDTPDLNARIDTTSGAGASLRRLTEWLYAELSEPGSLLSNEIGAAAAQELFLQTIVMAAAYNGCALPRGQNGAAAPAAVHRAEDFMRSKAEKVLTIEDIANAAGCSVRALQLAFRRFRGTSPTAALRRVRLELAYQAIMRLDESDSVWEVAARYEFSNSGRFAKQYLRAFGEYPSMTLRNRAARSSRLVQENETP